MDTSTSEKGTSVNRNLTYEKYEEKNSNFIPLESAFASVNFRVANADNDAQTT